eukprot:scaffold259_cov118-Isochrysis_galbana.AAC.4
MEARETPSGPAHFRQQQQQVNPIFGLAWNARPRARRSFGLCLSRTTPSWESRRRQNARVTQRRATW